MLFSLTYTRLKSYTANNKRGNNQQTFAKIMTIINILMAIKTRFGCIYYRYFVLITPTR